MMRVFSPLLGPRRPDPSAAIALLKKPELLSTDSVVQLEEAHAAHNYHPLRVVISKAKGVKVWDPEGRSYYDFLSGYGTVSQGHLNSEIAAAMKRQLDRCTLTSRAFFSSNFGRYSRFITKFFGYERVLAMNTGAEAVETAFKMARKWGYEVKKIPRNRAIVVCCSGNFHGRTMLAVSMSNDPSTTNGFGPFVPNILRVPYGDAHALERVLKKVGHLVAGFIVEPVQGEAGVVIPPVSYLKTARKLCTKHNVLLIADEVQCGIGRTGYLLASQASGVRPDVVILAKALGGGFMPVSAVLADNAVMNVFTPGTHGSTFGGNPLANEVAIAALTQLYKGGMIKNAKAMGALLLRELRKSRSSCGSIVRDIRGRGLFLAIEFNHDVLKGNAATEFMHLLKNRGVLAKVTHGHTIRMSPPLVITKRELLDATNKIRLALADLCALVRDDKANSKP